MSMTLFLSEKVTHLLPPRPSGMNKGDRGRLLVAGGSKNYPGAPILTSLAALRSGGGIVSLLSLPEVCHACASRVPEVVQLPADLSSKEALPKNTWLDVALEELPRTNAAAAGPGLGRSPEAVAFVRAMWEKWDRPLLLDGDALYALAVAGDSLPRRVDVVLTPHEGEAARLLSSTPEEVRRDRAGAAERLSKRWGCVLLKGEGTLIASINAVSAGMNPVAATSERRVRVDQGGPELSVPGSGDVLSGCVGAFLARGTDPFDAALLGGTLHALAGRRLRDRKGLDGILASEIADELPFVIRAMREGLEA
ncbi:MAG: NAD(P)H-hydrate dehydratase [Synergistaceae bacterium]|jgi:NAD(P)H-hydrate epimerase|nr:NAD(P)H-hydrate dehydratase [Synergistaceae bacterium]